METRPHGQFCRGERRSAIHGKGLSDENVRTIRADTRSMRIIGAEFNISAPMVYFIKTRKKWAHVPDQPTEEN